MLFEERLVKEKREQSDETRFQAAERLPQNLD